MPSHDDDSEPLLTYAVTMKIRLPMKPWRDPNLLTTMNVDLFVPISTEDSAPFSTFRGCAELEGLIWHSRGCVGLIFCRVPLLAPAPPDLKYYFTIDKLMSIPIVFLLTPTKYEAQTEYTLWCCPFSSDAVPVLFNTATIEHVSQTWQVASKTWSSPLHTTSNRGIVVKSFYFLGRIFVLLKFTVGKLYYVLYYLQTNFLK